MGTAPEEGAGRYEDHDMTRQHCLQGAVETEPTSTRSGFRFGKFCSTSKLLCIFFTVAIGLGCSAFALSSYGSGGVSELLESVLVPDAAAIPVSAMASRG